jgi:hypothetical protein
MIHDGMMDDGCVPKLLIAKNTILVAEFLSWIVVDFEVPWMMRVEIVNSHKSTDQWHFLYEGAPGC